MSLSDLGLSLEFRVYAVTGGGSGIGAATVKQLARYGASAIWIGDFNTANFDAIVKEVSEINPKTKVYTQKLDVSNSSQVDAWIDKIVQESGGLHGAANVAGVPQAPLGIKAQGKAPAITFHSDEEFDRIMRVNLNGVFYSVRAEVRAMTATKSKCKPAIVNIASLASIAHFSDTLAYGASKAAVAHMSISVAKDVKPFGIRCNAISPGNVRTPMSAVFAGGESNLKLLSQEGGAFANQVDPLEIASSIVWLLSDASEQVTGVNLLVGEATP